MEIWNRATDFLSRNFSRGMQSLAHVLSLCEGTPEEKCRRTMELFHNLKAAGRKYGTEYELPTLGIFALTDADSRQVAGEMLEIDSWLSEQKGFGALGSVGSKQRLMYAGMLAQKEHAAADVVQTAAVRSTVALIVAQEMVMCAAIAASTAAAAAASSSSS